MDPTVTAAAIGVGGTVIVGVAGFSAAIWTTRKTIAHARESRVWDRRADVYVEALDALHYWRIYERAGRTVTGEAGIDTGDPETAQAEIAELKPPVWEDLNARLQAFASAPVFNAMAVTYNAHLNFVYYSHQMEAGIQGSFPYGVMALMEARDAGDKAVELIRTELQGRGKPITEPREPPRPGQEKRKRP